MFLDLFIDLKVRETQGATENEGDLPFAVSFPQMTAMSAAGSGQSRSQELHPSEIPSRVPNIWDILACLPECMGRGTWTRNGTAGT